MDLSEINGSDFVSIISTIHSVYNKRYNCNTCLSQYDSRPDSESMIKKMRSQKACESLSSVYLHQIPLGKTVFQFQKCIGNFVDYRVYSIIEYFDNFEKGILPFPGSMSEQPAQIMSAFNIISQYKYDRMIEDQKKLKSQGQGSHGGKNRFNSKRLG